MTFLEAKSGGGNVVSLSHKYKKHFLKMKHVESWSCSTVEPQIQEYMNSTVVLGKLYKYKSKQNISLVRHRNGCILEKLGLRMNMIKIVYRKYSKN